MSAQTDTKTLQAKLTGIRPLMFDRYPGDNKTKLPPEEKLYFNDKGEACIPIINLFSLLAAQNTPSVAKRFWGKQGRDIATGVMAFVNIEPASTQDAEYQGQPAATLRDETGQPYKAGDKRISVLNHVARLAKGIPNPASRPTIPKGWSIQLRFDLQKNESITDTNLKKAIEQGGILGLGTFRPIFGRYTVEFL